MASKRKTLPNDFEQQLQLADLAALQGVFDRCLLDARGGYDKKTALGFDAIPDSLAQWLVAEGADLQAVDAYQRSPLHSQAKSRHGKIDLLLDLGASLTARDYMQFTPLHSAAYAYLPHQVARLVARGADVNAVQYSGKTALAVALEGCNNIDISPMATIAECLLAAGDTITDQMRGHVQRIGEAFELIRENFNPDYLEATENGLARLYKLFDVTPAVARRVHDGISPIVVTATRWQDAWQGLWDLLVPAQGPAQTVQGEAIRICGRLAHEILVNGGANWDADFRKMLQALLAILASGQALPAGLQQQAAAWARIAQDGTGDGEELAGLQACAVQWVRDNPVPLALKKPAYRR